MKKLISMLAVLISLMISYATASEADIIYISEPQTFMVSVLYENDDVTINLIDPEGNKVSLDSENVEKFETEGSLLIVVKDAAEGQWKIEYDKGSNESIQVSAQLYEEPIWIDSLVVQNITDTTVDVKFSVSHSEDFYINYEIYLGTDADMTSSRELDWGSGKTNSEIVATVDFQDVNTYDEYYIMVYAYYEDNGMTYFDEAVSEPFAFNNAEEIEGLEDYYVEINETLATVYVSLDNYVSYGTKGAYVTVKEDGTAVYEEFLEDEYELQHAYSDGISEIEIAVSIMNSDGRVSEDTVKTINLTDESEFRLQLPEASIQKNFRYTFGYSNADEHEVFFTVNNEETKSIVLNGTASYYFALAEYQNEIYIEYMDKNNVKHIFQQSVAVDDVPPALTIYEDLDGITTEKEKIIVTGKTDSGSKLTINSTEVEINENGTFSYEATLVSGVNQIEINASDEIGNTTTYVMKINRQTNNALVGNVVEGEKSNKILEFIPLAIALFASIFGIIELSIVASGKKKNTPKKTVFKRFNVVLLVFSLISTAACGVWYFFRRKFEKSEEYIDMALDFPKQAYKYLETTKLALILIIVFAAITVLAILLVILANVMKKHESKVKPVKETKKDKKVTVNQSPEISQQVKQDDVKVEVNKTAQNEKEEIKQEEKAELVEGTSETDETKVEETAESTVEVIETKVDEVADANNDVVETPVEVPVKEEAQSAEEFVFCGYCGAKIKESSKFCGKCGKKRPDK